MCLLLYKNRIQIKFSYLILSYGYFEHIWWRLFWAYLMMVILSISDEGYFEHIWWRLFWAYLMKVILSIPDEGYSRNVLCTLNYISTFFFKCPSMSSYFGRGLLGRDLENSPYPIRCFSKSLSQSYGKNACITISVIVFRQLFKTLHVLLNAFCHMLIFY